MKKPVVSAQAKAAVSAIIDSDTLVARLPAKDRQRFEVQVSACQALNATGERWRRICCVLMTLAPLPAKLISTHTAQFYIPDGGKYRKQVFALRALETGDFAVYMPNIIQVAIDAGMLAKPKKALAAATPNSYRLTDADESVTIDPVDSSTPNPDPCYNDMTGWNRKAMCVTVPTAASAALLAGVESLCGLASLQWAAVPTASPASR